MPKVIIPNNLANQGRDGFKEIVRKFARVSNAAAVPTLVWDGATPYEGWLPGEETLVMVSTSDLDKSGSTGAGHLEWTGQGEDGIQKTYSIELDGTTPVESITLDPTIKWDIIYTANVANKEGTNLSPTVAPANRGIITITSKTTGKLMAQINVGKGRTQMAIYRIPKDHYALMSKLDVYPDSNKPVLSQLFTRPNKVTSWQDLGDIDIDNQIAAVDYPLDEYIAPGTDLCLVITPEQAGTNCSSQLWVQLVHIDQYEKLLAEEG